MALSADPGRDDGENRLRNERCCRKEWAFSSPTVSSLSSESRPTASSSPGVGGSGRLVLPGLNSGYGIGIEILLSVPVRTPLPYSKLETPSLTSSEKTLPIVRLRG